MGCPEGRSSDEWVDYDFFGHQLVVHLCLPFPAGRPAQAVLRQAESPHPAATRQQAAKSHCPSPEGEGMNVVDGHDVPVPHFGVVLTVDQFEGLAARIAAAGVAFVHSPMLRFAGLAGEQRTMFLRDPAGNALEFKAFADDGMLFAR